MIRAIQPMRPTVRSWPAWTVAFGFALAVLFCVPLAIEAGRLLATEDDPVAITDRALARAFDAPAAVTGIEDALKAKDTDLAKSFVELADDQRVTIPPELRKRVDAAVESGMCMAVWAELQPDKMAVLEVGGRRRTFGELNAAANRLVRLMRDQGLMAGDAVAIVCTNRVDYVTKFVSGLNVGTVNIWEVPGYRLESTPFGGIKDSGLGYKEGVVEAMKSFTNVKTYSIPW